MRTNFNVSLLNCKERYTVAADYCDRSRRKTKLQDNTQRQQREKNTTEILPFYLKENNRREEKTTKTEQNLSRIDPYIYPSLPFLGKNQLIYLFVP